jgi:eukaryotic-like serine/threonine-protein kinase
MSSSPSLLVAGRYRLREVIGSGGAGAVWRATDELLGRSVAVKEVQLSADDPGRVRERVLREARAAARLHHPAVTAVFDVVEEVDTVHIVMELVDGPSLRVAVRADGPLAPADAAALGLRVLDGLEAAHARGIVHRDVKPGNVLLSPTGPKLTDFGIAALEGDASLTVAGTVLGSPSFMSPEQARGRPVGPASDLWGLGALLHFAVEGRPPFDRGEALPTLAAVVDEAPAPAPHAGPLAPVIEALLRKAPEDRPDAVRLRGLLEAVAGRPAGGRAGGSAVGPAVGPADAPADGAAVGPADAPADGAAIGPAGAPVEGGFPAERAGTGAATGAATGRADAGGAAGRARPRGGGRAAVVGALVLVAVLLTGGVLWALGRADEDLAAGPGEEAAVPQVPADATPAPGAGEDDEVEQPDGELADQGGQDAAGDADDEREAPDEETLPDGWTRSSVGPVGASVGHPAGWEEVRVSPTIVDHREPGTGTYLRTDWTDSPAGDPVEDWRRQSAAFGERREGYEELRIEPTEVDGLPGAVWEYRYVEGGASLRAINVAIVAGDHAYALNIQSAEGAWADLGPTIDAILASFRSG